MVLPANITCFVKNKTSFDKTRKHVRMFFLLKNPMTESKNEISQTHKKCMTYFTDNFKTNAFFENELIEIQIFIEKQTFDSLKTRYY